ncbi:hypothetical protein L6164_014603 [Bauhinia variegata]|uniref:Uncharacterized protein n=1 Tax=Bauhinia variegata TaxID=167791 RepID=A0ACB9NI19_BAUVA|nr:hypothetical protein L6164_014603 [Bauhinia variegata]
MEEPFKEQPSAGVSGNSARPKLQRYTLRSSLKPKEDKPDAPDLSNSASIKRGRLTSSVSKSVGVLNLSGKEKSAKPPRRLSIPAKSSATPGQKLLSNITPISETRSRRSANGHGRNETPISDISRPSNRKKFNTLTSASYWLQQIKLSESDAKHKISLGFFKLALEAGCEAIHLQRMQDELKSYVHRHQLAEFDDIVKELFEGYNITENTEQLQVSETISPVPEEGNRSSDDDVQSSSSTMGVGKLKPKCLNIGSTQPSPVTESTQKETGQKKSTGSRVRGNFSKNSANSRPVLDSGNRKSVRKTEKPSKQEPTKEKGKIKKQEKKSDIQAPISPSLAEAKLQGNKENMDAQPIEETSLTEVV